MCEVAAAVTRVIVAHPEMRRLAVRHLVVIAIGETPPRSTEVFHHTARAAPIGAVTEKLLGLIGFAAKKRLSLPATGPIQVDGDVAEWSKALPC